MFHVYSDIRIKPSIYVCEQLLTRNVFTLEHLLLYAIVNEHYDLCRYFIVTHTPTRIPLISECVHQATFHNDTHVLQILCK